MCIRDRLWASYGLGFAGDRPVAMVTVMHSGRPEEAARDLAGLRAFGPPLEDSIQAKPHLAPQTMNDEAQAWGQRFSMKSAFLREFPDELVARCVESLSRAPAGTDSGFSVWACGRAIARVPNDAQPWSVEGRYVNDVVETDEGLARSIYGAAKYDRLVALKREWDPDNVFRLNQNIRP